MAYEAKRNTFISDFPCAQLHACVHGNIYCWSGQLLRLTIGHRRNTAPATAAAAALCECVHIFRHSALGRFNGRIMTLLRLTLCACVNWSRLAFTRTASIRPNWRNSPVNYTPSICERITHPTPAAGRNDCGTRNEPSVLPSALWQEVWIWSACDTIRTAQN